MRRASFALIAACCACGSAGDQPHAPWRPLTALSYVPMGAACSHALDELVLFESYGPLHLIDPSSMADVSIGLATGPISVSVSPDGLRALVGHLGAVSYVDLSSGAVIAFWPFGPVGAPSGSLVLGDPVAISGRTTRFGYLLTGSQLIPIDLGNGNALSNNGPMVFARYGAAIEPGTGRVFVLELETGTLHGYDIDAETGIPVQAVQATVGPVFSSSQLWVSDEGTLLASNGMSFSTATLAPKGRFPSEASHPPTTIGGADWSPAAQRWAIQLIDTTSGFESSLWIAPPDLQKPVRLGYPYFDVLDQYPILVQWAFFDRSGTRRVIGGNAEDQGQHASNFVVFTL